MRYAPLALLALGLAAAPGCVPQHLHTRPAPAVVHAKAGPPPHAPAHGYRYKHPADGVELVFDGPRGVYVVVGLRDHYFQDDHYYRLLDGVWWVSRDLRAGWHPVAERRLPPGLRKVAKHGHKGRPVPARPAR